MNDHDVIVIGRGAPGERIEGKKMAHPILVTGAAGRTGADRAHGHRTAVEARQSGACDGAK